MAESLDTSIFIERNQGLKVGYSVPYTGGGTSECYPFAFSTFKHGQPVVIKRSIFIDVCIVLPLTRKPIDKNPGEYLINRHI